MIRKNLIEALFKVVESINHELVSDLQRYSDLIGLEKK
jgi:hypothetical protein